MSKRVTKKQATRVIREQQAMQRRRQRTLWTSVVAAVVLVIAGLVGYVAFAAQQPAAGFRVPASATPDQTGLRLGNGPVTVEVYLDYLCPACRQFEADAGDTLESYLDAGRITLIYHPVAILNRYSTNEYSTRAAAGAGCAADAGKLAEYTEALYADQPAEGGPGHTNDRLIEIAGAVGLPTEQFGQCLREGVYEDWVTHVTTGMARRGVGQTPTVFVNGSELGNPSAQRLTAAIDAVV